MNVAARRVLEAAVTQVSPLPTDWKLVSILTAVLIAVLSLAILLWWP